MKVIRVAKDLYDFFVPVSVEEQHDGKTSCDPANGWGRWTRIRLVAGTIKTIKGHSLAECDVSWLRKKFKDRVKQ